MSADSLDNLLGIQDSIQLARIEESASKTRAKELFETGMLDDFEIGTFHGLSQIHYFLFQDIYPFAGCLRGVNISKGNFRFASVVYLREALEQIDGMPWDDFDEILEKYVEMNVAHPFREGNGRSMRIWLDSMLKAKIGKVIDWSRVNRLDYLLAMERSPVKDLEIKSLLASALTDRIEDREIFMRGIDASYAYEGYSAFKTEDLPTN